MTTQPIKNREALNGANWVLLDAKCSPFKPEIYFIDWQKQALCIKDFSHCSAIVRKTLGRWIVNKEASVLAALDGTSGVPHLIGTIDGPALIMKRLDANVLPRPMPLKLSPESTLTPAFFEQASILLATLHSIGITHGDIHRNNLLIDGAGQPVFIDFASALVNDKKMSKLKGWAWRTMAKIDLISVLNLRQKYFPDHPLSTEEVTLLATQPKAYSLHNKLRKNFVRPMKRFFRSL
ncbi:MAG: phosphotransferase [Porticoccaceae bacterium]|nr:phosphotransferase [Porticoccaceae bacterium]